MTAIEMHRIRNENGVEASVLSLGGIIRSLLVPDRDGTLGDVVLGFDDPERYRGPHPYFGAIIGRCAGRIAGARFELDGRTHQLSENREPHHLHGGERGFSRVLWDVAAFRDPGASGLRLRYISPAGEEGYPGTLRVTVTYSLTDADELALDYHATTDAPTPISLTQHSYFNLAGHAAGDILGHELMIDADAYTRLDDAGIPTGEILRVEGTPLDFRTPAIIGARIDDPEPPLGASRGYNHVYLLNDSSAGPAARARDPESGRVMEVFTTEPCLVFYTANHLDGSLHGKGGAVYGPRSGLALETQWYQDSPNQPAFPSAIVRPGEEYSSSTVYRFSVDA